MPFNMDVMKNAMDEITKDLQTKIPKELDIVVSKYKDHGGTSGDIVKHAYTVGERLPDFYNLLDTHGVPLNSVELRSKGPLIITFFRGDWCPWCHTSVNILSDHVSKFQELGASALVAISPQTLEKAKSSRTRNESGSQITILSDPNCEYAQDCNLAFCLDDDFFQDLNYVVPEYNGGGLAKSSFSSSSSSGSGGGGGGGEESSSAWYLPVPATYVVDTDGIILYRFLDTQVWKRVEPNVIMQILIEQQAKSKQRQMTRTFSNGSTSSGGSVDTAPKMARRRRSNTKKIDIDNEPVLSTNDITHEERADSSRKRGHPEQEQERNENPRRSPGVYSIKHKTWLKHQKKIRRSSKTSRISHNTFQLDNASSSTLSQRRKVSTAQRKPRDLLQKQKSLPTILEDESSSCDGDDDFDRNIMTT